MGGRAGGCGRAFWPRGVFSSSSFASVTLAWILPISVRMPVAVTTPMAPPLETVVPENIMLSLLWMRASFATSSRCLSTVSLSPVREPSSVLKVVVLNFMMRTSAGTLSPTRTSTTSPGTSSDDGTSGTSLPLRSTFVVVVCISLSASRAFSALCSCQTPTTALMISMSMITKGSTKACRPSSPSPSKKASTCQQEGLGLRGCGEAEQPPLHHRHEARVHGRGSS